MRSVLLFIVLLGATSACEKKEVSLSLIDTFTGGNAKEWLIAENYFIGTNVTELEPCYKDDTVIFSKGEEGEAKLIPIYIWQKNESKCSGLDEDLKLYFSLSGNTIIFGDQDVLITGTGDIWNIEKADNAEIIISQNKGTSNERRLRFVPITKPSPSVEL